MAATAPRHPRRPRAAPRPELAYLQEQYRDAFADALRAALADLTDRERTLLRLYHVDGLSLETMAALYRVHLSTVSRWLTVARERVADATARHLRERLGVGRSEVDSIAALVLSQIDVSLTRLLGGAGRGACSAGRAEAPAGRGGLRRLPGGSG